MQAVSVAQTQLPLLLRHRGGWLAWLKNARAAQVGLVCTLVACLWLLPPLVEGLWGVLLPQRTKSGGFLGLQKTTVSHPWVQPLTTGAMVLLWVGGAVVTLRLLLRELPSTLRALQSSPDVLDDTCLPEVPDPEPPASEARRSGSQKMEATDPSGATPSAALAQRGPSSTVSLPTRSSLVLARRYALEEKLGEGGMGEVYLAQDRVLERKVALKRLPPDLMSNPALRERFRREARSLARLNHVHVVQLFDFIELLEGEEGAGMWMVLEVVPGGDLQACLDQGRLPLARVLELALQMARALQAAHAEGIVHRDFKPANVMLTKQGEAKVTDFGIARLQATSSDEAKLTQTGTVMGTPTYMSPEQARGAEVGPAGDVYSLGATLYEMLSGQPLFEGALARVLTDHIMTAPVSLADRGVTGLPQGLEPLVLRMLAKETTARPSLSEIIDYLEAAVRGAPMEQRRSLKVP